MDQVNRRHCHPQAAWAGRRQGSASPAGHFEASPTRDRPVQLAFDRRLVSKDASQCGPMVSRLMWKIQNATSG